jgi:hypothetical protein
LFEGQLPNSQVRGYFVIFRQLFSCSGGRLFRVNAGDHGNDLFARGVLGAAATGDRSIR